MTLHSTPVLSIPALRCGGPAYMPQSTVLRAGPLTLLLEQGELRRIRLGTREVLRRIYLTVRGPDWSTIPGEVSSLMVDAGNDSFRVAYALTHKKGEVDYTWDVGIVGNADGTIRFEARGRAATAFLTNRVGICVLHPLHECTGMPVLVRSVDDEPRPGKFPELIEPHQPFLAFNQVAHLVEKEWLAMVHVEGETFEMEDQRNWSDGSFKTYSPPQDQPKPRRMEAGQTTLQKVILELQNPDNKPISDLVTALAASGVLNFESDPIPTVRPKMDMGHPVTGIGFGMPSHGQPLDPGDIHHLKGLAPFHLRADFRLGQVGWQEELTRAATAALELAVPLEVALVVPENHTDALSEFASAWERSGAEAVRWLIFSEKGDATLDEALNAAREHLGGLDPLAAFARGSKGDFVLLNRNRPAPHPGIALAYAISPQVHLTDNRTLVESHEGQTWIHRTVASVWPRSSAIATPITLKRSPFTIALKKKPSEIPGSPVADLWRTQVDTRQFSLFGAGWVLGTLKRLALSNVNSATLFEATGLLGVLAGQNVPKDFLTSPAFDFSIQSGWVYPMYHVFADFAEFVGGNAYEVSSDLPLRYDGVLLHVSEKASLLLANLEETPGTLRLEELGNVSGIRRLNETNAMFAMQDPSEYRKGSFVPFPGDEKGWTLELKPFEVIRVDLAP